MGTQEEQITHNKTGEAKLNMQNTGRDTVKIKTKHTEMYTKTHRLDTGARGETDMGT